MSEKIRAIDLYNIYLIDFFTFGNSMLYILTTIPTNKKKTPIKHKAKSEQFSEGFSKSIAIY